MAKPSLCWGHLRNCINFYIIMLIINSYLAIQLQFPLIDQIKAYYYQVI